MPTKGLNAETGMGTAPAFSPLSSQAQMVPKEGKYSSFLHTGTNTGLASEANQFQFLQSNDGLHNIHESEMVNYAGM